MLRHLRKLFLSARRIFQLDTNFLRFPMPLRQLPSPSYFFMLSMVFVLSNVILYALKTAKEAYLSFIVMCFTTNQWIRLRSYSLRTPGL